MPLNPTLNPYGDVWVLRWENGSPVIGVVAANQAVPGSEALRYTSHLTTCPGSTFT